MGCSMSLFGQDPFINFFGLSEKVCVGVLLNSNLFPSCMKWYVLTHVGAEKALQHELSERGLSATIAPAACIVEATKEEMAKTLYHLQCATRVLLAVHESSLANINPSLAQEYIGPEETFRVSVEVLPAGPDRTAMELAAEFGECIDRAVNLDKPDKTVFFQVGTKVLCGIDVAGDLSKRYYRVFSNAHSVKGTLAACVVYAFKLSGGVLDPFGNTGEIAIESALRSTRTSHLKYRKHEPVHVIDDERKQFFVDENNEPVFPVWCFDPKLANLRTAKKNAKLAGVEKSISFSKLDTEWMDVKFGEGEVGNIITIPPPVTKRSSDDTHLKELCYQAAFVLKKGGSLVVACETEDTASSLIKYANDYKLRLREEVVIYSGNLPYHVMRYEL